MKTYKIVSRNKLDETVTLKTNDGELVVLNESEFRDKMVRVKDKVGEFIQDAIERCGDAFNKLFRKLSTVGEFMRFSKRIEDKEAEQRGFYSVMFLAYLICNGLQRNMSESVNEAVGKRKYTEQDYFTKMRQQLMPTGQTATDDYIAAISHMHYKNSGFNAFANAMRQIYGSGTQKSGRNYTNKNKLHLVSQWIDKEISTTPLRFFIRDFIMFHMNLGPAPSVEGGSPIPLDNRGVIVWGAPGIGKTQIINQAIEDAFKACGKIFGGSVEDSKEGRKIKSGKGVIKPGEEIKDNLQLYNATDDEYYIYRLDVSTVDRGGVVASAINQNAKGYKQLDRLAVNGVLPLVQDGNDIKGYHIIVMDEFSRAQDSQLFSMLTGLMFNHNTGTLYLPKNTCFIAMSNRPDDHHVCGEKDFEQYAFNLLTGANGGRFEQLNFIPSYNEWMKWANQYDTKNKRVRIHPVIRWILSQDEFKFLWFDDITGQDDEDAEYPTTHMGYEKRDYQFSPRVWSQISDSLYFIEDVYGHSIYSNTDSDFMKMYKLLTYKYEDFRNVPDSEFDFEDGNYDTDDIDGTQTTDSPLSVYDRMTTTAKMDNALYAYIVKKANLLKNIPSSILDDIFGEGNAANFVNDYSTNFYDLQRLPPNMIVQFLSSSQERKKEKSVAATKKAELSVTHIINALTNISFIYGVNISNLGDFLEDKKGQIVLNYNKNNLESNINAYGTIVNLLFKEFKLTRYDDYREKILKKINFIK